MRLWEIDNAMQFLVDEETGELKDPEVFMELQMERDEKIQNTIRWYKNTVAEATALKAESQALADSQPLKAYDLTEPTPRNLPVQIGICCQ